jgi:transcriptional regulator with XRE-family HTH domain
MAISRGACACRLVQTLHVCKKAHLQLARVLGAMCQEADLGRRSLRDSRNAEIGQRIRAARLRLGLNQGELGKTIGVSYQQVNKYEKGINALGSLRLLDLAGQLRVTVSWLVGESDIPENARAVGSRRSEWRVLAAFSKIEDRELQLVALRAMEALATASQARCVDAHSVATPGDGDDDIALTHVTNGAETVRLGANA